MANNLLEFIISLSNDKFTAGAKRVKKDFEDAASGVSDGSAKMAKGLGGAETKAKDLADALGTAKVAGQAIGAGFIAAGGAAALGAVAFADYSQKLAEVSTLVKATPEQINKLSDSIRKSSVDLGRSATESTAAIYDIISAGVDYRDSVKVMELATKAAIAGVTDTGSAAKVGLAVINAYGKEVDDLGGVYDVLFQTVKDGVTTLPELSASLGNVLPAANASGVAFEEVAASIATMTKSGINTPQAVTALNGAITALAAPAKEAKDAMAVMGIEWKGLTATLSDIGKLNLTVAQMREIIPDTEARKAVLALTSNFDGLTKSLDGMQNSAGAMTEAHNKMKDTPTEEMNRFNAAVSDLFLSLGELVTGLTPVLTAMTGLVRIAGQLPGPLQGIIVLLGAGATASAAYALATFKIADAARLASVANTILTTSVTRSSIASALGATANAGLSVSLASVATAGRAAAVALGPIALLIGAGVLAANELIKTFEVLNAELEKSDKAAENVGKIGAQFDDLKKRLQGLGVSEGALFDEIQQKKLLLMRTAKEGADVDSAAAKKIINNTVAKVAEIERLEKQKADTISTLETQIAEQKKTLETAEKASHTAKLAEMTVTERLFGENIKQISTDALAKKLADGQSELAATKQKLTESLAEEKRIAGEITALEDAKAAKSKSIDDKIRAIKNQGLSEEQLQAQVKQDFNKAILNSETAIQEAIATGSPEAIAKARALADESENLASQLKKPEEATAGLLKIKDQFGAIANAEITAKEKSKAAQTEKTKAFQEQVDKLAFIVDYVKEEQTLRINADVENAQTKIKELEASLAAIKDKEITVTAKLESKGFQNGGAIGVPGFQRGGALMLAGGGGLPGYGGGDRRLILGEDGEYMYNKEWVKSIGGLSAARRLHKGINPDAIKAFLSGGSTAPQRLATGGPVGEVFEIRTGGQAIKTTSERQAVIGFIKALGKERGR